MNEGSTRDAPGVAAERSSTEAPVAHAGASARPGGGPGGEFPRWKVFPPLALGVTMATLDISVVNIALPTLQRTFGVPVTTVEWVVLAYVVTITGLLLGFGRFADAVGRRRVYAIGLGLFTFASILCGAAPTVWALVAARVLQGVGAGMLSANSAAILTSNFPGAERGKALGAFGAMVGVGLAIGPPLGGLIVGHASWRWIFFLNVPLGLLAMQQLFARVPDDRPEHVHVRLELGAVAAWCLTLVGLTVGLSRGPELGWAHPLVTGAFALCAAGFVVFLLLERRSDSPLLPPALLFSSVGASALLTLIAQGLTISVGFHLPLYLEDVLGFGASKSGGWLAMLPLTALLVAPMAGRWSDRFGAKTLLVVGMLLTAGGFFALSHVGLAPHPVHIQGGMALIGLGQGLFTVPNSSTLLAAAPRTQLGLASGLQATMRNLGITSGAAGMAALVASRYAVHGGGVMGALQAGALDKPAFAAATHDAYLAGCVVAVLAALVAWVQHTHTAPPQEI